MKNYWLERIRNKEELAERWKPPTEDEGYWLPIRPEGSHQVPINCCANYDGMVQQEPLFVSTPPCEKNTFHTALTEQFQRHVEKRWERTEFFANNQDFIMKGDAPAGMWEVKNVKLDCNVTKKLEELKLKVMAENPQYLGVPVELNIPDHIVLDTTNVPTEITVTIGSPENLDVLPQTLTVCPEEPVCSYDTERYGPDEPHWYLEL